MKLKLRLRKRQSLSIILFYVAVFCVVTFALLEHVSISIGVVSVAKMPLLYLGGVCLLFQFGKILKTLKKKRNFYLFLVLLLLCALLYLSAWFNQNTRIGISPTRSTTRLVLYLLELFLVVFRASELRCSKQIIAFLYRYILIVTIVTDVLLFSGWISFTDGAFQTYLVGTKFNVAYFHMNLFALWFMQNRENFFRDKKSKRMVYIGVPLIALVSIYVDCMTGVLGCLLLLVFFILLNTPKRKYLSALNAPFVLMLSLMISIGFPFAAEKIMEIPSVQYFVESVLGRSGTLTGRLNIFGEFSQEMQNRWIWGVGFGNGNAAANVLFGYANAQNALLNWLLQAGIPATAVLIILVLTVFHYQHKSPNKMQAMPLVLLVYVYVLLGSVEITFDMSFLLWIAMIFLIAGERKAVETVPITETTEKSESAYED